MNTTSPQVPFIPESAPFNASQRAWLNGFFAGLTSRAPDLAVPPTKTTVATNLQDEDSFPWHDPALGLDERMTLAEGKPLERVVMAAMAQLDCGSCGYVCKSYAEAIARGEDKDLTKCSPGGRATAKKLREIMSGNVIVSAPANEVKVNGAPINGRAGSAQIFSRSNPYPAKLVANQPLNGPGSAKDTRLIGFDLADSGLSYSVGDSLGVYAENCPETVIAIIRQLGFDGTEVVGVGQGRSATLFEAMLKHLTITKPSESLVRSLAEACEDLSHKAGLLKLIADEGVGIPDGLEVIDLLNLYPTARLDPEAFAASLSALQPRLYSICSSQKATPRQVYLTVGCVRYTNQIGRPCRGVASTFLADRLARTRGARIFVHPARGFAPPTDPGTPIIMVGPGTGIAPFRAFLQERAATAATGRNWLFFGDQRAEHDYLYRDELEAMKESGLLTRLDLAFSRDQEQKLYVQTRMAENAAAIWSWLQDGAHFYVCGDAKRMAKDVDDMLKRIVSEQGDRSADEAAAYVKELGKAGRYQRDVY